MMYTVNFLIYFKISVLYSVASQAVSQLQFLLDSTLSYLHYFFGNFTKGFAIDLGTLIAF